MKLMKEKGININSLCIQFSHSAGAASGSSAKKHKSIVESFLPALTVLFFQINLQLDKPPLQKKAMVRHGMVTIGVAVQSETFSDSENSYSTNNTATPTISSILGNSSTQTTKSAIFLPPSRNGASQTLKITFSYNKESNLPEVVVNFNEEGEDQYQNLQLSEIKNSNSFGKNSIVSPDFPNKSNAVQVYYFEKIDKPYTTEIFEIPSKSSSNGNAKTNNLKDLEYKEPERNMKPQTPPKPIIIVTDISKKIVNMVEEKNDSVENSSKPTFVIQDQDTNDKASKQKASPNSISPMHSQETGNVNKNVESKKVLIKEDLEKENPKKSPNPPTNNNIGNISKSPSKSSSKMSNQSNGKVGAKRKSKTTKPALYEKSFSSEDGRSSPSKDIHDRSKIPIINSASTDFMPCEYYRQKWLQEMGIVGYTDSNNWGNNYNAIQKTAGQKVVNKMTAQQKKLEEEAAVHKKRTEFIFHEDMGSGEVPQKLMLIRKKQTRLEPLTRTTVPKCY